MPDFEIESILLNIFGKRGYPLRKFWRMMYWMPKFKNLSPWPVPDPLPNDVLELAKIAIARIASVDVQTSITVFKTSDIPDSVEDTWIVSAQSITQKKLLSEHNKENPVYVEGTFKVWIKNKCVNYFILRGDPKPVNTEVENLDDVSNIEVPLFTISTPQEKKLNLIPSVHEQPEGVIYSVCATGTSGRDSVLSWIRHLEKNDNPCLASIPVIFTLKSPGKEVTVVETDLQEIKN
ncbi:evolutionarily conserved signaling intermediate in Toll pathway, mitochondrial isoform X2 [Agrilus planipennis]|nr:evolutionarily conserved signaling intermediate in Toll pathway, mitochondrial isoform X2 [Agrilus planipennis]